MPKKKRLDEILFERGLAESLDLAQRLVMAGQVRVEDQVVLQPSTPISSNAQITVDTGPRFVSRGGEKLEAAFQAFQLEVTYKVCADIGASTGGFTDCLLQHGALRVYAVDVGKGILDWRIRQDQRVIVMEGTNARALRSLPESIWLATMDVSFISLKALLPAARGWFDPQTGGQIVALIKPQFEARRDQTSRGKGVIRDSAVHRQVLQDLLNFALTEGYGLLGLTRSPLLGAKGNIEFLAWLGLPGQSSLSLDEWIESVVPEDDKNS